MQLRAHLRLFLRHLLVVVVVAALVPGLTELAESVGHLVHDGHLPHSSQHDAAASEEHHDDGLNAEHGCTPVAHHCGCHSSMPATLGRTARRLPSPPPAPARFVPTADADRSMLANAPPTPPPIA